MSFKRVNVDLWKINDMNHNWHIGQDIVCIKTHHQLVVKEGEIFTIKGLKQNCCGVIIDVGKLSDQPYNRCYICKKDYAVHGIYWLRDTHFAPLDTLTDISEIEEILSQPIESLFKV